LVAPGLQQKAGIVAPATVYNRSEVTSGIEKPCSNEHPDWRPAQVIEGVTVTPHRHAIQITPMTLQRPLKAPTMCQWRH